MKKLNRQQTQILQILRTSGKNGMNSYLWRPKFIQLPVRIKEMKEMGYLITTRQNKNRSVDYVLVQEPEIKTPKVTIEPIKMMWITYKNTEGYNMAKQVPVNPIDEANLQQQLSI